ncbi:hypothetical protein BN85405180 [Alteracholeplasma palmae J233]|uniref:Uncharacterized protein n=2 Tax=Acholeplasma palmae TaxID=38986 RepID=U4KPD8_ALTPJ|nr:hypothetical protein BN85405180 [Alteracholeplasma palmae J233]
MLLSVLIITGTLDFQLGKGFSFKSHINAILQLDTNIVAFYLFLLNITALVQTFFAFSFSKAQSPKTLIMNTVLTLLQLVITVLYVLVFLTEGSRIPGYKPGSSAILSIMFLSLGALFMTISTAFAWKYVNWKYVKIED